MKAINAPLFEAYMKCRKGRDDILDISDENDLGVISIPSKPMMLKNIRHVSAVRQSKSDLNYS